MNKPILEKFAEAYHRRESLRAHTNAIRLVNGAGDGLDGLVLEQYDQHCVAQVFTRDWFGNRDLLCGFVCEYCDAKYFVVKDRTAPVSTKSKDILHDIWIGSDESKTFVQEYGVTFEVDLNDTINTGLFLDMRANRQLVANKATGAKVLNGFAYTCSFGVHCKKQGALSVTNVDISCKVLDRGARNYQLNGVDTTRQEFVRCDVMDYLTVAVKKRNCFDLIILDPPSFARSGKKSFSVKKDMASLLDLSFRVLNPVGQLFISTNFSGMAHRDLEEMITVAAKRRKVVSQQSVGQDIDFVGSGEREDSCLVGILVEIE